MNTRFAIAIFIIVLAGCANSGKNVEVLDCWDHQIAVTPAVSNTITFCFEPGTVAATTHFPNFTSDSTNCRHSGRVTENSSR
jgi:hypothetical protein